MCGYTVIGKWIGLAVNAYYKLSKKNTKENKRRTAMITTIVTTTNML